MTAVQSFVNKHHDFLLKYGGFLSLAFLIVFIPCNMAYRMETELQNHIAIEANLQKQVNNLSDDLVFYRLDYEKQQSKMREVECLAKNIYYEAGSEPYNGKVAVAEVTINRVRSGFANSVCGVVRQKVGNTCQFSWYCKPKKAIANVMAWSESQTIAKNILIRNKKYGIIGDAKYFHASYVEPSWAESKEFKTQIGNHLFYR